MKIEEAGKNWTELGREDPMWAILSAPDKQGGKWSRDEFFATGREQVQRMLEMVKEVGVAINFGRALDFGCGLGRLSQGLAAYFQRVDGVDISQSMIEQARTYNNFADKVQYHVNVKANLDLFAKEEFDFICSHIVLQHIPPKHQLLYVSDFMNLLKSGGVACFQTIQARALRALVPNWIVEKYRKAKHHGGSYIPMYGVDTSAIEKVIRKNGCVLREHITAGFEGWEGRYASHTFIVVK